MKMISYSLGLVLFCFFITDCWSVSPGANRNRNLSQNDKEYLFPGTGFFSKNRDPLENDQAKAWFLEAEEERKKVIREKHSHYTKIFQEEIRLYF